MSRGRPREPNAEWRMHRLKSHGIEYACTRSYEPTGQGGEKRIQKQWGKLTDGNRFEPSANYFLLSPAERKKFIFPEDWDLSEIKHLPSQLSRGRPPCCTGDASCKLYGHVWLLEQLADKSGVLDDLIHVFDGNKEKARDVLTLSMFLFLEKEAFSHVRRIQRGTRYPAVHPLDSSYITRLLQSITENDQVLRSPKEAPARRGSDVRTRFEHAFQLWNPPRAAQIRA